MIISFEVEVQKKSSFFSLEKVLIIVFKFVLKFFFKVETYILHSETLIYNSFQIENNYKLSILTIFLLFWHQTKLCSIKILKQN